MNIRQMSVVIGIPLLAGCAAAAEKPVGADALQVCVEPRPQACTMDYRPVCGELADGSRKTYSNGCGACADSSVAGWREGACSDLPAQSKAGKTYSYRCDGEDSSIVVTLKGDRGHLFSRQASQALRRDPGSGAFVGADVEYLPHRPPDLAPGQTAQITIKGNVFADCKNNPRAAIWEAAKLRGVSYRAVGQEPPWTLEIHRGQGFVLSTGYEAEQARFPYSEPESDSSQRRARYRTQLGGDSLVITIIGEGCQDSMSGESFSTRTEVEWRGQSLRGCGRALY